MRRGSLLAHRAESPAVRRRRLRLRPAPYIFIAPFLLAFAVFTVYPLSFSLELSFTNWEGGLSADWIGLSNYIYLLGSPDFWNSLLNSGVVWVLVIPAQLVVSLLVAVALNRPTVRFRGAIRVALMLPFVTPLVAMAQVWIVLFDTNYGAVNFALGAVGIGHVPWLTSVAWVKPTIALLFLWKSTGFVVVLMLSSLQSIPDDLYEASALDGAGTWRQLRSVTVPLMRRTVAFVTVLQTLAIFQMFAEPYVLTKGGPYNSSTTAGLYLYNYIQSSDLGTGAANSFLLVAIALVLSLGTMRLLRARD